MMDVYKKPLSPDAFSGFGLHERQVEFLLFLLVLSSTKKYLFLQYIHLKTISTKNRFIMVKFVMRLEHCCTKLFLDLQKSLFREKLCCLHVNKCSMSCTHMASTRVIWREFARFCQQRINCAICCWWKCKFDA